MGLLSRAHHNLEAAGKQREYCCGQLLVLKCLMHISMLAGAESQWRL